MSKSKNNVPGRPIPCTPYNQCTTGNTPSKMVIKSKLINGDIIVETQDGSVFRIEGAGSMDIMEAGGKAWREDVTYSYGDMVVYNDEIYLAMAKSRQCPPSEISDKWTVYQSGNGSGGTDGTDGRSTKILLFSTEDEFLALKPEVGDIAMAAVFIIFDRELVRTATRQILAGDTFMYDGVEWIYQGSLRGAVGEAGIPGSPGYQGLPGDNGVAGIPGTRTLLFSTEAELLALTPNIGDIAMATLIQAAQMKTKTGGPTRQIMAGDTFIWDGTEWEYEGSLRGAVGLPGVPGQDGLDGVAGAAGAAGLPGNQGIVGPSGTRTFLFASDTEFNAITTALKGDIAMATAIITITMRSLRTRKTQPGDTFIYDGTDWAYSGSLRGMAGIPGAPGNIGAPGLDGGGVTIKGTMNIADILALLVTAPTPPLAPGDMYIALDSQTSATVAVPGDRGDGYVYSANPVGFTNVGQITGPIGPAGTNGRDGLGGAAGLDGTAGADGKDGKDGGIGPKGPAGNIPMSFNGTTLSITIP